MHNGLQRFTSLPFHFSTSRYINFQKKIQPPRYTILDPSPPIHLHFPTFTSFVCDLLFLLLSNMSFFSLPHTFLFFSVSDLPNFHFLHSLSLLFFIMPHPCFFSFFHPNTTIVPPPSRFVF